MKPRDQFGLDALLGRWPAQDPQEHGGPSWEQRADAIVASAAALKDRGSPDVLDTLTAPPALEPEPGEADSHGFEVIAPAPVPARASETPRGGDTGGAQKMSSDQGKKPSLKDLAARASQARASLPPEARSSSPPVAAPATVTPIAKARASASGAPAASRASDPGREDSGVLRLADLQAKEEPRPAAKSDAPAAAASASAAKTAEAAPVVSPKPADGAAAAAKAPAGAGSRTGVWAGAAIALLGVAAAFAIFRSRQPEAPKPETVAEAPKPTAAAAATEAPKPAAEAAPAASGEPAPAAATAEVAKGDDAKGAGSAAASSTAVAAVSPTAKDAPKGSKVGTLDEEMKKAVGANDLPAAPQDDSKPAAGGSAGNVPEQPSQGNAQAAIRAVMGGAKACVAGATEPSTASVTFSSSGSVQSVSVGGWAAANGKGGCVKSALQGARVSPFAKPTYTVPVTIRP